MLPRDGCVTCQRLGVMLTGTWIGRDCLMLGAGDLAAIRQKS